MSALLTTQVPTLQNVARTTPSRVIDPNAMPAFCPMPEAVAATDDGRLAHLFRGSLKLGRIHPLYLPMLKFRHARNDRG